MSITFSLADNAVGTVLRSLIREAEAREAECIGLSEIVSDAMFEIAELEDIVRLGDEAQDMAHDRMEELTARETANEFLRQRVRELELELDAMCDLAAKAQQDAEDLTQENKSLTESLIELSEEMEYIESLMSIGIVPPTAPIDSENPYAYANAADFESDEVPAVFEGAEFPTHAEAQEGEANVV